MAAQPSQPFPFFSLPRELRDQVYTLLLRPDANRLHDPDHELQAQYRYDLRLYQVSRQMHEEALQMFRLHNVFARIETPWDEAREHIRIKGVVPVVASGDNVDTLTHYHARVVVDSLSHEAPVTSKFIIHVEHLDIFTTYWQYSDLSYDAKLNPHLRLRLYVGSPLRPTDDGYVEIGRKLQRQILMPFGRVKNLRSFAVEGLHGDDKVDTEIEKEMRAEISKPYTSPEECLDMAQQRYDEGLVLAAGVEGGSYVQPTPPDHTAAIQKYLEAFLAIHIVCEGRKRAIWADAWFDRELEDSSERFAGEHGQAVRLILRVELVAAITKSYYMLGTAAQDGDWIFVRAEQDPDGRPTTAHQTQTVPPLSSQPTAQRSQTEYLEESKFWGMRTIDILREQVSPDDDVFRFFPAEGKESVGLIYLYTGLAMRELARLAPMELSDCMSGLGNTEMKREAKKLLIAAKRWASDSPEVSRRYAGVTTDF